MTREVRPPRQTTGVARLPTWLRVANPLIVALQRLGIAFFTFHLLSVRGRTSGTVRTTPVSPFTVDGRRYLMSLGQTNWVRNARSAHEGVLSRGRRQERVALVELPPADRAAIAHEFPRQVPHGVRFFLQTGVVQPPGDPAAFERAAANLAVFRLDSIS